MIFKHYCSQRSLIPLKVVMLSMDIDVLKGHWCSQRSLLLSKVIIALKCNYCLAAFKGHCFSQKSVRSQRSSILRKVINAMKFIIKCGWCSQRPYALKGHQYSRSSSILSEVINTPKGHQYFKEVTLTLQYKIMRHHNCLWVHSIVLGLV